MTCGVLRIDNIAMCVCTEGGLSPGSLRVNGEETLGSASPPVQAAAQLPDLAHARYWVGGVPPGAQAALPPGALPPALMGCIGALTVDREGYNILETPTRFGVEPTCDNRVSLLKVFLIVAVP